MIGSERLSQLRADETCPTGDIAAEFAEALRIAHDDLGANLVRAHAILHDDNAVVTRDPGGALRFDFSRVDAMLVTALVTHLVQRYGADEVARWADHLYTELLPDVTPDDGTARFDIDLPMPGIARIRLSTGEAAARYQ